MRPRQLALTMALLLAAAEAAAGNLVLPVFAHNAVGADGFRWSSELYLANPNGQPVQVTLEQFLPGYATSPTPCRAAMAPTRVVPPHSAVVWAAAGLSTDLGCADEALGGLVLNADGPLVVTSRIVRHREPATHGCFLAGVGQEIAAIPVDELPSAGAYLLPTLHWQRGPEREAAFATSLGFANPGPNPVTDSLQLAPETPLRALRVDDARVDLPYLFEVPPASWRQLRLGPAESGEEAEPESVSLEVTVDGPLAFYASVVDRSSQDPRTVLPVPLR
jgi:hypothetical protein